MTEKPNPAEKPKYQPGDGIRSMQSTSLFRAVNFELYARPVSSSSLYTERFNIQWQRTDCFFVCSI